jgi:hypothetical protein
MAVVMHEPQIREFVRVSMCLGTHMVHVKLFTSVKRLETRWDSASVGAW